MPLDSSLSPSPSLKNTWVISLILSLISRVSPKSTPAPAPTSDHENGEVEVEETDDASASDAAPVAKPNGVAAATVKAGGRRRKAAPKRK